MVAHEPSKTGKGHCGALALETPDGRRFSCGSGLTDKDRAKPPAKGSMVTYRYTELSDAGIPRFPRFVAARLDGASWADYCASYEPPVPPAKLVPPGLQRQNSLLYTAKHGPPKSGGGSGSSSSSSSSSAADGGGGGGGDDVGKAKAKAAATMADDGDENEEEDDDDGPTVEVTWQWKNGRQWVDYEAADALLLESEFAKNPAGAFSTKNFTWNQTMKWPYRIDLKRMTQTNMDSTTARKLCRVETRFVA